MTSVVPKQQERTGLQPLSDIRFESGTASAVPEERQIDPALAAEGRFVLLWALPATCKRRFVDP
jgi:hypothetical protein